MRAEGAYSVVSADAPTSKAAALRAAAALVLASRTTKAADLRMDTGLLEGRCASESPPRANSEKPGMTVTTHTRVLLPHGSMRPACGSIEEVPGLDLGIELIPELSHTSRLVPEPDAIADRGIQLDGGLACLQKSIYLVTEQRMILGCQ